MLIPKVSVKDHHDDSIHEMKNVASSPLFKYHANIELEANRTDQNIIHTFELMLNGQSAKQFADVTVLSESEMRDIIDAINLMEDHLNWLTFDQVANGGGYEPLVYETATVREVIERLVAMENAITWGTFDSPKLEPNYDDDLPTVKSRIGMILDQIEWQYRGEMAGEA